ncbi:MAG TPA: tRNA dihydrouridine synthase DusB [Candidatus Binatia bacterium]|nr:tRNA dihydrouridine synthase DusB [Candidatus Binatia bacterium]
MSTPSEFHVGAVRVSPNAILAPMSGITDSVFRRAVKEANPGAVGLVVTELISIEALSRRDEKSLRMLRSAAIEQPLSIQLFGADPDRMAEAARLAADCGAAVIDINCGCPVPKVVKRGGGAELMRQSTVLAKMLRAIRRAVALPVTVKIRAGWDESLRNAVEVARMVQAEGAAMVAVHGRTRVQLYSGVSDWNLIAAVKAAVRIPVVGSGDIDSAHTALRRMHETGVDGVMIGRGALTNPWMFQQLAALRAGRVVTPPAEREVWQLIANLIERLASEVHPAAALGRGRGLVCRMTRGLPYSAALREMITRAPSLDAMLQLVRERAADGSPLSAAA